MSEYVIYSFNYKAVLFRYPSDKTKWRGFEELDNKVFLFHGNRGHLL